jgi:hypothetical protein
LRIAALSVRNQNGGNAEIAQRFGRRAGRVSRPVELDRSGERGPHAGQRLHQFRLAVAANAGDAVDLAGADMKGRIRDRHMPVGARRPQAFDGHHRRAGRRRGATRLSDGGADRKLGQFVGRG